MAPPDVVLLDSRDSFTFNLAHAFAELGVTVDVASASHTDADAVRSAAPGLVCIGPGPRGPAQMPELVDTCRQLSGELPLFGVCLGMQALALAHGGEVGRARAPVHGKRTPLSHAGVGLFAGLPSPLWVMRYHSLVVTRVPRSLEVIAWDEDDQPMALQGDGCAAVQFHPESIGTAGGLDVLRSALRAAGVSARVPRYREGAVPPPDSIGRRINHG